MGNSLAPESSESTPCMLLEDIHPTHPDLTPIRLNVYNITEPGLLAAVGLGLYHTGIEVFGREYSYGRTDEPACGIFWLPPRSALAEFSESVLLGHTAKTPQGIAAVIEELKYSWAGQDYNMLHKNCNHFSEAFANRLGLVVPEHINRAARFGDRFLPEVAVNYVVEKLFTPGPEPEPQLDLPILPVLTSETLEQLSVGRLRTAMLIHNLRWDDCFEKQELVQRLRHHLMFCHCQSGGSIFESAGFR
eukprot:NODE_964_length_1122_cov_320.911463_g665_i0.p1 GENE.NODE_964_length_1122_cov_320.911463_g665_i0~~NODE_964_length_1122_cov_320.911463_g665_i0.p1  ORF type:complete len:247 (-),score=63.44 NODE_964_length_1122_cov_320.911463_g665_i0:242-982(-)